MLGKSLIADFALFCIWFVGLILFAGKLPKGAPELEPFTSYDAGIVLTGGKGRISTGFDLYSEGAIEKLYISGVGDGITVKQLLDKYHRENPDMREIQRISDIAADDKARSTVANAKYTAKWIKRKGVSKALLITAGYHMPRSQLIFETAMPKVQWVTYPVFPEHYHPQFWWKDTRGLALVISEYHKYVFTSLF